MKLTNDLPIAIALSAIGILIGAVSASAACHCACYTAAGTRCTVSVPNYLCGKTGDSVCTKPLQRCQYDCREQQVERPTTCSPRRRCSVRE